MNENDALLNEWSQDLVSTLELDGFEVDIETVLGLAGRAAHGIVRPAAPLTTYIAGLAAGMAVGLGQANPEVAQKAALAAARRAVAEYVSSQGEASAPDGDH